jgi:hypothetical protein
MESSLQTAFISNPHIIIITVAINDPDSTHSTIYCLGESLVGIVQVCQAFFRTSDVG